MSDNIEPFRKPVACPSCTKKSDRTHYPFCSKRCAELDLHRWFSESYALPGEPLDEALEREEIDQFL